MYSNNSFNSPSNLADQADQAVDQDNKSAQHAAKEDSVGLAKTVQDIGRQSAPFFSQAAHEASDLAKRGIDRVRETSQDLRDKTVRVSDTTVNYIKDEPVKAMLIAAATGAVLISLARLMGRSRGRE